MGTIDVVLEGYVRGEPHEIESLEKRSGPRGGREKVRRTYRIFEIDTVEAIEGASKHELEDTRVLVYPAQGVLTGLSSYEQMLLLEAGTGDNKLSNHLKIYGTFEKADKKSLPFAGMIEAWEVTSLDGTGPQYRPRREEAKLELLQKKE